MTEEIFFKAKGTKAEKAFEALVKENPHLNRLGFVEVESDHKSFCDLLARYIRHRKREIKQGFGGKAWATWAEAQLELLSKIHDRVKEQSTVYPATIAKLLIAIQDQRLDPKTGPLGCVDLTPKIAGKRKKKEFLFFTWSE